MNKNLDLFENKVLNLAIRDKSEWQQMMKKQIPYLKIKSRDFNSSGFVTYFDSSQVPDYLAISMQSTVVQNDIEIINYPPTINAIRTEPSIGLVSFIVWLNENGKINYLEAFSLTDDEWPSEPFESFVDFQDDHGNIVDT